LLAACGSSSNHPASGGKDGAARDADARAGDAEETGNRPADAHAGDATDTPAGEGGVACTPGCAADKACVDGTCLPAPVVLARAPGCGGARLALWGGYVYWTEQATGTVKRLAVVQAGGAPRIMAAGQSKPGPIATDDLNVYWSNEDDLSIRKTTHEITGPAPGADASTPDGGADASASDGGADAGGAPPLLTAPAVVRGLATGGGFLYYTSGPSTLRVAPSGGAPLTLASFAVCKASQPVALALDGDYVYQTDVLSQYVTRERNDGTQSVTDPCAAADAGAPKIAAPETITHSQGELFLDALYVAGGEVVWADHTNVYAKLVVGATSSREVATSAGANAITGFVVTGGSVYLAEGADPVAEPTSDTIQVAPLGTPDGGADTPMGKVVAVGQHAATSFVADAANVYWVTRTPSATAGAPDDCAIVSLAK
jgi:hypothetical protein